MKFSIQMDEEAIRKVLADYLNKRFSLSLSGPEIDILVKSKQNYKSEWEFANIKIDQTIVSD